MNKKILLKKEDTDFTTMEMFTDRLFYAVEDGKEFYIRHDTTDICDNGCVYWVEYEDENTVCLGVNWMLGFENMLKHLTYILDEYTISLMFDTENKEFYIYGFATV